VIDRISGLLKIVVAGLSNGGRKLRGDSRSKTARWKPFEVASRVPRLRVMLPGPHVESRNRGLQGMLCESRR
jgi:hypothetical protein